jgi:hypothetical protein
MRSLHDDFLTYRSGVSGPEQTTYFTTDEKDNTCEGSADYLKRKKPGTGVNVCICRLGKSTENCQYLNDSGFKDEVQQG